MWNYYNHALISCAEPHETIDLQKDKINWKSNKHALLARWTSDFDNPKYKDFWYVIKDTPFNLNDVKAKRRYEINKAIANFDVKLINPSDYIDGLCEVQIEAFSAYPEKYRPVVNRDEFAEEVSQWGTTALVFGAFLKNTGELCGYNYILPRNRCFEFYIQKTKPQYEKLAVNAGLVYALLQHLESKLKNEFYICDGARNINHETKFQDYLEKYFNFRKAYCKLNIKYRPIVKPAVKVLYLFKNMLKKFDNNSFIHKVNAVLKMEEIVRAQRKQQRKVNE